MKNIPTHHLAYIAGLVDGEGAIGISRDRKSGQQNYSYGAACTITNTYYGIHLWLLEVTGIGVIDPKKRKPGEKQCWVWRLRKEDQADFLQAILPYLKIKRDQAELLLEFHSIERSTPIGTPDHDASMMKSIIYDELSELNKRGS